PGSPQARDPASDNAEDPDRLREEIVLLRDQLLRALAEQENLRRRAAREQVEAVRFAAVEIVTDLLPTADNLRRAIEILSPGQSTTDEVSESLRTGLAATEQGLLDAFARHGIVQVEAELGAPFDPHRHQAMFKVDATGYPAGTIAQILQPGF